MVISSRTPEGDPNRCPICGAECRLEPSEPARDGPCPQCGHLLWFARDADTTNPAAERVRMFMLIIEERFGPTPAYMRPSVEAALEQARDDDRLLERALKAASLADLLAEQ